MRLVLSILALSTATVAIPALAEDTVQPSEQAPAKPPKVKKVCRTPAEKTGSRMGVARICKTPDEWAEYDAANAEKANQTVSGLGAISHANR